MTDASPTPPDRAELEALVALVGREHRAGRLAEAAAACRRILALHPDLAQPHNKLGVIHLQQGQFEQAAACFHRAIALQASYVEAHANLGNVLVNQGKLDAAAARFETALALRPDLAEAHYQLGDVFSKQGKPDQAAARFESAIALKPDYFEAHSSLASLLLSIGKLDQAASHFALALALRPDLAAAHNNLGETLWRLGKADQAAEHYRQALSIDPNLAEAQMGLAVCYLLQGDFQRGWPAYEARLRLRLAQPQPQLPRWEGQPLAGRSLLLLREQGLGDTLQFMRLTRLLKAQGARVVLAVPPALGPLLGSQPDPDELLMLGSGEALPAVDFYLPLLSLPGMLGLDASNIPAEVPYLWPDRGLREQWRQELSRIAGFKIGIAWQGSPSYTGDPWRSIPLAQFAPLARLPGVRLISLQKGPGAEQIRQVDFPVVDFADRLDEAAGPFMDTAAVIANLDLFLTSDSAVAHLAGALAAPVFMAVTFARDWRWLTDREDCPWYPTMRLFRQTTLGQWSDVFERIAQAVAERVGSKDIAR